MTTESIIKCKLCGEPYVFQPFLATNQSACPSCVRRANENTFGKPDRRY